MTNETTNKFARVNQENTKSSYMSRECALTNDKNFPKTIRRVVRNQTANKVTGFNQENIKSSCISHECVLINDNFIFKTMRANKSLILDSS